MAAAFMNRAAVAPVRHGARCSPGLRRPGPAHSRAFPLSMNQGFVDQVWAWLS